jgi:peptidoglycan-associated lipoprotein
MKPTILFSLTVVSVVLALGATGCKKKPQNVTNLPGLEAGTIGDASPSDRSPGAGSTINLDTGARGSGTDLTAGSGSGLSGGPSTASMTGSGFATTGRDLKNWASDNGETFRAETVYFDFDRSNLRADQATKVVEVARRMKSEFGGKGLRIQGHCDERGTEEYNRALGERRALAIRERLILEGISADLIDTLSYGEDRPAVPGHDESAWARNRRGEFELLTPPGASR